VNCRPAAEGYGQKYRSQEPDGQLFHRPGPIRNDEWRIDVEYQTEYKVDSRKKKQKGSGVSIEKEALRL
jgi:hypothetical protein